ncbi:SAM-dependent methyltransferases [Candidatus Brocadia sinica JPN1]|uniref:SAM-dependent methyltransferases n=1 Tax=Candidatus Brocadia sinica JPN1 TaxID=1197129 RepID=A0ABQ0JSJ6_9BACT|nr:hypothetical protein [Candidatus Brocadia sp.]RIJ92636.1 MAG: hypothetical protein DB853_04060 [Candidatus Brocadia sp.]GAN31706.1 SAM-dependent methyltransferases [Candidatus Brocadia sinica JPN1]GIK12532.1 MAG: hypothetical protein BroJett002_12390 [Candidatus Brocadia sinica]GJQ17516.1 MAG: hypothetical protein HBSIN01_14750 [Candidatus Brocadia sinica]
MRIFPLLDLGGFLSSYVEEIAVGLQRGGYAVEFQKVPYEFQRGGDQMIRIKHLTFTAADMANRAADLD